MKRKQNKEINTANIKHNWLYLKITWVKTKKKLSFINR